MPHFTTCQYIAGDPAPDDSCKCGAPTRRGSPWCDSHRTLVYVDRPPDQAHRDFALFFGASRMRIAMHLSRASVPPDWDRP
jgi:hypothetical protein